MPCFPTFSRLVAYIFSYFVNCHQNTIFTWKKRPPGLLIVPHRDLVQYVWRSHFLWLNFYPYGSLLKSRWSFTTRVVASLLHKAMKNKYLSLNHVTSLDWIPLFLGTRTLQHININIGHSSLQNSLLSLDEMHYPATERLTGIIQIWMACHLVNPRS